MVSTCSLVLFFCVLGFSSDRPICHRRSRNAAYSLPTSSSGLSFGYRAELLELNLGTVKPSLSPGDLPRLAEDLTIRSLLAAPLYQTSLQEQDADSALRILAAALGVE